MAIRYFLISALLASGAFSEPAAQQHLRARPEPEIASLPIQYTISAMLDDRTSLLIGTMELQFENTDSAPISEFVLHVPSDSEAAFSIDSVLFLGAPLDTECVHTKAGRLYLELPQPIAPGAVAHFLTTFKRSIPGLSSSKNSQTPFILIEHWFPRVPIRQNGKWLDDSCPNCGGSFADYNLALDVDSSFDLVVPGHCMNEKEHFGLLPPIPPDSVQVNIATNYSSDYQGNRYRPVFEDGRKRYYVRAYAVTALPLGVAGEYRRDRTRVGDLIIEVVYPAAIERLWAGSVAAAARKLVEAYTHWLGAFPYDRLTVLADPEPYRLYTPGSTIILPTAVTDTTLLQTALAIELARGWFAPTFPEPSAPVEFFDEGLAYYVATRLLYEMYGVAGYDMIRTHRQFLFHTYPRTAWTRQLAGQALFAIPSQLHALTHIVGDGLFWRAVREYSRRYRQQYVTADDLWTVLPQVGGDSADASDLLNFQYDLSVSDVTVDRAEDVWSVSYTVGNHGTTAIATEIGFVMGPQDTVYRKLGVNTLPLPGEVRRFEQSLARRPRTIVIDPNHLLPDRNRADNFEFTVPIRFHYRPPRNLFPPYDVLE